jgi:transcriptional regulator with XRE-family HTH domain
VTEDEADAFYTIVGMRAARLRTDAGLTQQQVADAVGLSRASIANFEVGRQRTKLRALAGDAVTA